MKQQLGGLEKDLEEVRLERDTLGGQAEKLSTILKGKDTELGKRKEVMDL